MTTFLFLFRIGLNWGPHLAHGPEFCPTYGAMPSSLPESSSVSSNSVRP